MKDNQKIQRYIIAFNRHSKLAQWGERALARRFYNGLPDRLQDGLSNLPGGKPTKLSDLRIQAMALDGRYWERRSEIDRKNKANTSKPASTSTSSKPASTPTTSGSSQTTNGNRPSNPTNNGSSSGKGKSASTSNTPSVSSAPDRSKYADKLDSNGKLTSAERTRRLKDKLCLFCGLAGHQLKDCRKRAAQSSARAATVNDAKSTSNPTPTPAPKTGTPAASGSGK